MAARLEKYPLYERAVQSPDTHIPWFVQLYRERLGRYPRRLREDFCGTFALSCEWVRRNRRNSAVALDLDPEPLAYGRATHAASLTAEQRRRLRPERRNVVAVTRPGADLLIACNFSVFVFKQRTQLVSYLRAARRSLAPDGLMILEIAGGPGMIAPGRERKVYTRRKKPWFTYVWDQQSFDPLTHEAHYAIHFHFPGGKKLVNAFRYDWRLWTIPELREALIEAGFGTTEVLWETSHRGTGTGEFLPAERGDNAHSWIAYVLGRKTPGSAARPSKIRRPRRSRH